MPKGSNTSHNYLKRIGSHSTKGFKNGFVDILPPQAEEMELQISNLNEQRDVLKSNALLLEARLKNAVDQERIDLKNQVNDINATIGDMRKTISIAKEERRSLIFYRVARHLLTPNTFLKIEQEVRRILYENEK